MDAIVLKAGPAALEHLRRNGLSPADVACVPAAAGGPKGLALLAFDRWLFGDFLKDVAEPPLLVGASIGAWRSAASAQRDPLAALQRLEDAYVGQSYGDRPPPSEIAASVASMVRAVFPTWDPRPDVPLRVLVAQAGRRLRGRNDRRAFLGAALANLQHRDRLAVYLKRMVFTHGPATALDAIWPVCDAFGAAFHALDDANARPALAASGSIPVICDAVHEIPGLPRGDYWDGAMIDYHLHLPFHPLPGLVLYPHFGTSIVPGWLDKHLPWRRAGGHWLGTTLLVAPSKRFLARLPNGKLPDRKDFFAYRGRDAERMAAWRQAIGECQRMVEEFARWCEKPDLSVVGRL
jgi:hypothetical protein